MKHLTKQRMFTPGPTPLLPEAILQAIITPLNHRKEDFKALLRDIQRDLKTVFKTQGDVLLLSCSGSGAMEAALTNLVAPGEKALIAVAGKFGERWLELAEKYGVNAKLIRVPYGESFEPTRIAEALSEDPEIGAVFLQALETSTGALMDIETIGRLVKQREGVVLIVDAITALGTMRLETDSWGLDVVIGGSQKAFMLPPGLAMLSVSQKAWTRIERCSRPRYYFDLLRERDAQRGGQTAFTPSIALIQGLRSALALMLENGIDGFVANAALQAGATRAAATAWGLSLFPKQPGDAVTALVAPAGVEPSRIISIMRRRFGAMISGGQGSMKGKIIRIGHLGYFDFLETLGMIGCLELALVEAGATLELGTGSRAALAFYQNAARSDA
jgi:aspartate aminotransferase-like enzyme